MTITNYSPTGFTVISLDYRPLDRVPGVSSLVDTSSAILSSQDLLEESTSQTNFSDYFTFSPEDLKKLSSDARWKLELEASFIETTNGERLQLECSISDLDFRLLPPESIGVAFSLYRTTCDLYDGDLPTEAFLGQTDAGGRARVIFDLKFVKSIACNLQFICYPLLSQETNPFLIPSNLVIGEAAFDNLFPLASNVVSLPIVERPDRSLPIIPFGLPTIPLEDAGIEIINDGIGQQEVEETIIGNITLPYRPTDEYSEAGFSNPQTFSPDSSADTSFQLLQGFTKNQSCRYAGWSGDILFKVHSHLSNSQNSEFKVVSRAVSDARAKLGLREYSAHLEAAGHHSTVVTSSYAPDPAYGHVSVQAAGTVQYNSDHFRIQAGSILDIHSASSNHVTNQYLLNARWVHLSSDTYQATHRFIWTRAEESHVQISKQAISYTSDLKQDVSARSTKISGPTIDYSDSLWVQAGQPSNRKMHPTNSNPLDDLVGQNAGYGEMLFLAMRNLSFVSYQKDLHLEAKGNLQLLSQQRNISASAYQGSINLDATRMINLRSSSSINILASAFIALDGRQVFINCGRAYSNAYGALQNRPIPVFCVPKTFLSMTDVASLPLSEASTPGSKPFSPPSMPTPSSTVGGPTELGSALYAAPARPTVNTGF